jgi:hypothetical protein
VNCTTGNRHSYSRADTILGVTSVLIAVAGVCGTLLAVVLTGRAQRDAAERASKHEHRATLRDLRIAVLSTFAANLVEYRRAELHVWHQVDKVTRGGGSLDFDDAPAAEVMREARSASWADFYHLRLVWGDADIITAAERLLSRVSDIEHTTSGTQAKSIANTVRRDIGLLIDKARANLAM